MVAELDCLITSGGLDGKQQTYALLDEVVAPTPVKDPDTALADFTRRYFVSHGLGRDRGSDLVVEPHRGRGQARARNDRRHAGEADDRRARLLGGDLDLPAGLAAAASFTQGLDEYFVGYQKTRRAVDIDEIGPMDFNGGFYHTLVVDGQVRDPSGE